jgi:oligoendopeptidase F
MAADLSKLPRTFKRGYLPAELEFELVNISKLFDDLRGRPLKSQSDFLRWLRDEDELYAYLDEQRSISFINSTRQTDNPQYTEAYRRYLQEFEPSIKVSSFELLKLYCASPFRAALPEDYAMEDRRRQAALRIFRVENVDLEKQDSELAQSYRQIRGAMMVTFRGQERTLQQMAKFLEDLSRGTREEAWRLADNRSLEDRAKLDDVYTRMVGLRDAIAHNAGHQNFEEYVFVKKMRFDYSPRDCEEFHSAVEEFMVPLSREIDRKRKNKLGVDALRPWDLVVDPDGKPPLTPFEDIPGLVGGVSQVVEKVDKKLSEYFSKMVQLGLLDLDSRKGKAPGGYQEGLSERRLPFIFMNAAKRERDVRILLHESGHSFHLFLMREQGLPFFNSGANIPLEFAEVASMSMEIMSGEHLEGVFYDGDGAKRSNWEEAVQNVKLFAWIATIDSFQEWVYSHPGHTLEERRSAWLKTIDRFGGSESYEGLEESRTYRWQQQLHLFEVPFYYIEYAIALTGALGVWSRYRRDRRDAIEAYKAALSLGGSRPLPELFRAAGVDWGFGRAAIRRCAAELGSAIREFEA